MRVSDFVDAFGNLYASIENTRLLEPKETEHHNKKSFFRELLCQIAQNENTVLYPGGDIHGVPRTLYTYESYYRRSQQRSLRPIALGLLDQLDPVKFIRFLHKNFKGQRKEKLLLNYQKYMPDTTSRLLFRDITRTFVQIINEAAEETDGRKTSQSDVPPCAAGSASASTHTVNSPVEELLQEIDQKITELIVLGRAIADSRKPWPYEQQPEQQSEIQKLFDQLINLAAELLHCNAPVINVQKDELFSAVHDLTPQSFILTCEEYMIHSPQNMQIHHVRTLLDNMKEVLQN